MGTPPTIADALLRAMADFQNGDLDGVERHGRAVLAVQAGHPEALHLIGLARLSQGRLEEAAALLEQACARASGKASFHHNLGIALEKLGRHDQAARAWQQAAALNPGWGMLHTRLAGAWVRLGRPNEAHAAACHATIAAPDDAAGHAVLAETAFSTGRLDEAATAARRAIRIAPASPAAYRTLGNALLACGEADDAGETYRAGAAMAPDDAHIAEGVRRAALSARLGRLARTLDAPPGLIVRGPFRDTSGYSYMVRRVLQTLRDQGVPVNLAGTLWGPELAPAQREPWIDRLGMPVRTGVAVHFELPDWLLPIPGLANVNVCMTEFDRVPAAWIARGRWHDRIVVPTESSRDAWIASGMPAERIRLCPLGCDPPAADLDAPPAALVTPSGRPVDAFGTRVLNVASLTTRKNLRGLLNAWARATRPQDDAVLILKLGKGDPGERSCDILDGLLHALSLQRGAMAEIVAVDARLSDREMAGLFRAATHYISLSYGEGWDLPMGQAGVQGLGLIAPDHSAYRTYLTPDVAHLIPARPVPVPGEKDGMWWEPDAAAATDVLRRILDGTAPAKASARDHLLARFRWSDFVRRLRSILEEAEAEARATAGG